LKLPAWRKGRSTATSPTKEELALLAFDYAWRDTSDKRIRNVDTVSNAIDKLKLHVDNYVNTPSFPGGMPSFELRGRCG
jgi:hypothetical protein